MSCNTHQHHLQKSSLSDMAQQFRTAYGVPSGGNHREMQLDLIREEYHEFCEAHRKKTDQETLKELADLVYVAFQYSENADWDLEEALKRVHQSNLSKLGLDGKPIKRSDGKILKGPNYEPPNLDDLVQ